MASEREIFGGDEWTSILLVPSKYIGWAGLRNIIYEMPRVRVIGDDSRSDGALTLAKAHRPSAIFLASHPSECAVVDLARGLRLACRDTRLIIVGNVVTREQLIMLERVPVDGYLAWESVSTDVIKMVLAAIEEKLRIFSESVTEELIATHPGPFDVNNINVSITEYEEAVLQALRAGESEKDIAAKGNMSLASVERRISALKRKWDASSLFALGFRGAELGLRRL
jgi:DNA-binding NarL/FixJ family response regulator